MRKFLLFPVVALMLGILCMSARGAAAESTAQPQYLVAGVAFYNLENLFDTINANGKFDLEFSPEGRRMWDTEKYNIKVRNLATAIAALATENTLMGPGIIGISEVENESVVSDLVKMVDVVLREQGKEPWGLKYVHHDSPDRRGVDVAMLYNPLYFELGSVNNHRLVIPDQPDFRTRDQLVVSGWLLGEPASVVVNHWPSRLGGQAESEYLRVAAGELSRHIADSLRTVNPTQAIMIMGDMNDDPQDRSCAEALGAVRMADDVKKGGLFNPFWNILRNGTGTLCYRGVWNLFDQIVVSESLVNPATDQSLRYWKATVHNMPMLRTPDGQYKNYPLRTFSGNRFLGGYSDHFPTQIFVVRQVPPQQ